jgi:hypothetical protein
MVAAAGYAYHRHAQNQAYQADKATFAKVETDMKTAYAAIVAEVGVPDVEQKDNKSCSHTARKFEVGTLRCSVSYRFAYNVETINVANSKLAQLEKSLDKGVLTVEPNSSKIMSSQTTTLYLRYSRPNIACRTNYYYGKPSVNTSNSTGANAAADFTLYCSGETTSGRSIYSLAQ